MLNMSLLHLAFLDLVTCIQPISLGVPGCIAAIVRMVWFDLI